MSVPPFRPKIVLNMALLECGGRTAHAVYEQYAQPVWDAGGIPLFCPVIDADGLRDYFLQTADGFLLIGGQDYPPALYGREAHPATDLGRKLPEFDIKFARGVLATGKPFLGICAGCQLLAIAAGGALIQDLPNAEAAHRGGREHPAAVTAPGRLAGLLRREPGEEFTVNSFHHQAVEENSLPSGWQVTARAFDGTVEAIEKKGAERLALGVQFHPERMADLAPVFFRELVADARRAAGTPC